MLLEAGHHSPLTSEETWVGKDLKEICFQPCTTGRDTSQQTRLPTAPSNLALNTHWDGAPTASPVPVPLLWLPAWCGAKESQEKSAEGTLEEIHLKTFRREEPISCKRPRTNPGLSGQPSNTFKCKDCQSSSCSAALKPGHLLDTAGKQSAPLPREP